MNEMDKKCASGCQLDLVIGSKSGEIRCMRCRVVATVGDGFYRCAPCGFTVCGNCKKLDQNDFADNWRNHVDQIMTFYSSDTLGLPVDVYKQTLNNMYEKYVYIIEDLRNKTQLRTTPPAEKQKFDQVLLSFSTDILKKVGGIQKLETLILGTKDPHKYIFMLFLIVYPDGAVHRKILKSKAILTFLVAFMDFDANAISCLTALFSSCKLKHRKVFMKLGFWKALSRQFSWKNLTIRSKNEILGVLLCTLSVQSDDPVLYEQLIDQMFGRGFLEFLAASFDPFDNAELFEGFMIFQLLMTLFPKYTQESKEILNNFPGFRKKLKKGLENELLKSSVEGLMTILDSGKEEVTVLFAQDYKSALKESLVDPYYRCGGPGCEKTEETVGKKLQVCSGCKAVNYCSRKCQKAHWKKHKVLCKKTINSVK